MDEIETVEAGPDPEATDTDHPEYADAEEGATEDGTPTGSTYDDEGGTAS
jgi:hypothetical protein